MADHPRQSMTLEGSAPAPLRVRMQVRSTESTADAITLADAVTDVYRAMFRRFSPFRDRELVIDGLRQGRPRGSASFTVLYPDRSPAVVSYVEPASPPAGIPRLRLKHRSTDARLLTPGGSAGPLLAHELGHALHFTLMPVRRRVWVTTRYLTWIGKELVGGRPGTHTTFAPSSPFVAWIEAFGVFAERYWRFLRSNQSLPAEEQDQAFLAAESGEALCRNDPVGSFHGGRFRPTCPGDDVEATVYGLVFIDLGRRIGLTDAVNLYLRSAERGILNYSAFAGSLSASGIHMSSAD